MRLFLDPGLRSYVRELADEMDVSPSQVKTELDNLNEAGLLESEKKGRQIYYRANSKHPLFPEMQSMVRKALGMDHIFESIILFCTGLKFKKMVIYGAVKAKSKKNKWRGYIL